MENRSSCRDSLLRYSAILGSTGVSAGAFGAHALKKLHASTVDISTSRLSSLQDSWRTAVQYQLFHAVALLALASLAHGFQQQQQMMVKKFDSSKDTMISTTQSSQDRNETFHNHKALNRVDIGGKMMFYGSVLFSGSIYCLSLGIGPRKILGPITPIGGLFMIGGWIVVGIITIL